MLDSNWEVPFNVGISLMYLSVFSNHYAFWVSLYFILKWVDFVRELIFLPQFNNPLFHENWVIKPNFILMETNMLSERQGESRVRAGS